VRIVAEKPRLAACSPRQPFRRTLAGKKSGAAGTKLEVSSNFRASLLQCGNFSHGTIDGSALRTNSVRLNRCPEYDDPRALLEHGIAGMVRITQCDDPAMALKASHWLARYAESLMKGKPKAKEEDASAVSPSGSSPWRVC
jgi:hypothetical protein